MSRIKKRSNRRSDPPHVIRKGMLRHPLLRSGFYYSESLASAKRLTTRLARSPAPPQNAGRYPTGYAAPVPTTAHQWRRRNSPTPTPVDDVHLHHPHESPSSPPARSTSRRPA